MSVLRLLFMCSYFDQCSLTQTFLYNSLNIGDAPYNSLSVRVVSKDGFKVKGHLEGKTQLSVWRHRHNNSWRWNMATGGQDPPRLSEDRGEASRQVNWYNEARNQLGQAGRNKTYRSMYKPTDSFVMFLWVLLPWIETNWFTGCMVKSKDRQKGSSTW